MNRTNPIAEDLQLFVVFRNIGVKLLQQLKVTMNNPAYTSYFKEISITDQNELNFFYFGQRFKTQIEMYFNHVKMPKSALLTTYHIREGHEITLDEIISYSYTIDLTIHDIYTIENFSEYYLVEFHQNVKKSFSDRHIPFPIRLNSK